MNNIPMLQLLSIRPGGCVKGALWLKRSRGFARRCLLGSGLFGVLVFSSGLAAVGEGTTPAKDRIQSQMFNFSSLEQIRTDAGVAALAVVLVDLKGGVQNYVSGVRDWDSGASVDARSVFRIGSVSKLFTGLALLKAEEHSVVKINQPIRDYLGQGETSTTAPLHSWYDNPWELSRPLNLGQLMEHTAGWHDMSGQEFDHSDPKPLSLAEALALRPESRRSQWPPGMYSEYSNSGAGLVAFVLEQASGRDFEALARRWVFAPLGMGSADYRLSPSVRDRLVQGYDRDGRKPIPYWHIIYRPAAGLNLVPSEMAAPLQMLLQRGEWQGQALFSRAQIERLEHPRTTLAAQSGLSFGYGLGIYQAQHRGHSLFIHGGDADGYLSHLAYSPTAGRGYFVVITAFNHQPLANLKELLNDWVVAGERRPNKPGLFPLSTEQRLRYAGVYRAASQRFPGARGEESLTVIDREGQLFTQIGNDSPRPLLAVSAQHFRRPWESTATAAFISLPDGGMVLQGSMGNWQRMKQSEPSSSP